MNTTYLTTKRERLEEFMHKCQKQKSVKETNGKRTMFPFKFLEGIDCPVCMVAFEQTDVVIQLRCHKFHLYHETCLNELLSFSEVEHKCLMCRNCIYNHEFENTVSETKTSE